MRTYRPFPPDGYVSTADPDGLYVNRSPELAPSIQVVNIGPLGFTPADVERDFPGMRIRCCEVLTPYDDDPAEVRQTVWGRLYLSIDLEPESAAMSEAA